MGIPLEIKLSAAEFSPSEAPGRQRYNRQRNRLLPIPTHGRNITLKPSGATNHLPPKRPFPGPVFIQTCMGSA